ncbi:hypothetical protein [Thalassospira povalilytica]|uniref:Uncharacterized protein n=1 Tax=Thalassospira povalilytica TaxID=732237 RepID=A0A8I1SKH0_9PROT|nr:hypothetical protein [Thalassospira povalilytica]MBN8197665.1 hypothetical protein [Thalassospira povalilytica]
MNTNSFDIKDFDLAHLHPSDLKKLESSLDSDRNVSVVAQELASYVAKLSNTSSNFDRIAKIISQMKLIKFWEKLPPQEFYNKFLKEKTQTDFEVIIYVCETLSISPPSRKDISIVDEINTKKNHIFIMETIEALKNLDQQILVSNRNITGSVSDIRNRNKKLRSSEIISRTSHLHEPKDNDVEFRFIRQLLDGLHRLKKMCTGVISH